MARKVRVIDLLFLSLPIMIMLEVPYLHWNRTRVIPSFGKLTTVSVQKFPVNYTSTLRATVVAASKFHEFPLRKSGIISDFIPS